ncbi:MAG: UDP-2,3-diacylglucosamine diphosphatase [Candidatus Cryptobacteroides sp.]
MAERTLVYFVSDVHLGLDVNDPKARERRFVDFLESIPAQRTLALYLLGDIWDFWYEYRDVVPKGYVRVFAALLHLMDEGVEVFFFKGNHDIWCYSYFSELGIKVLEQPVTVTHGGRKFCLGHGDGLGPGNRGYKLMRSAFHGKFLQRLFSTLHPYIAFRIGYGWSRRSRLGKSKEYSFKGEEEPLWKFALEYDRVSHVDYFIFGHYHTPVDMTLPSGARFLILDDWVAPQSSNWILFDTTAGCSGISQKIE